MAHRYFNCTACGESYARTINREGGWYYPALEWCPLCLISAVEILTRKEVA